MERRFVLTRAISAFVMDGTCVAAPGPGPRAQNGIDPDAQSVLAAMSRHLAGLRGFSAEYSAVDEVVTTEGQKLQFLHSGEITAQRPNRLHAIRKGAAGTVEVFLDGERLSFFARDANAYLQIPASSIDAAVGQAHRLGIDAPGADLLLSNPMDASEMDVNQGVHVGMTSIDGVEVHHLALRGNEVDWQLWVTVDNNPLPVRYVVTTKSMAGSPQYTLELKHWNSAPQVAAARFAFNPPQGARQLDPAAITVNAIGDMTVR